MKIRFWIIFKTFIILAALTPNSNATLGWLAQLFGLDFGGNGYGYYGPGYGYGNGYRPNQWSSSWSNKNFPWFGGKDFFGFNSNKWAHGTGNTGSGNGYGNGAGWRGSHGNNYGSSPWGGANNYGGATGYLSGGVLGNPYRSQYSRNEYYG